MRQIIKKHSVVIIILLCSSISFTGNANQRYENSKTVPSVDSLLEQSWNLRNADPDYSLHLSLAAIEHSLEMEDYYNLAKAHSFAGVASRIMGNYNRAIEYFFEGLHLSKEHHIPEQEGYAYINIANLYLYLQYYNQALENLEEALTIALEIDNKNMLGYIYLYQGRAEMNLHDYENAIESINKSLEIREEQNNVAGQAVNYKYLGDLYLQTNRESEALVNYQKAIEPANNSKDKDLLGNIYIKIAQIYCREQNYEQAVEMANRSLEIGKQTHAKPIVLDALKILEKDALNDENYRQANHYQQQIQLYQDSIFNQQLNEKVLVLEFEMEQQKKQAELALMEKEKELKALNFSKQKQINRILIGFLVLFFLAGVILYILLRKIETKNKLLHSQKEELKQINLAKNKMLMIIGHDLRNPVWNLKAL
ncbi:MAG: tetratricopeptide repeat protein, partial [Bacteroidota bacterium]